MEIKLLTKEHIYLIHQQTLEDFGGEEGYYDYTNNRVESILAQQYPYFGYDKYPTVFLKAAMLMFFFTTGHCFVDGNKRVGIQAAISFLDVNGYSDFLDDDEGTAITLRIASIKIPERHRDKYIQALASWLEQRFVYGRE